MSASDQWPGGYGELGSPGGAGREEKSAAVAMLGASVHFFCSPKVFSTCDLQHHSCG